MAKATGFMEYAQHLTDYKDAQQRIKNFDEFLKPLDEGERREQAARCMDCGIPFCHSSYGCPVDNLIPEWNNLIYEGKWQEAYERLRKTNNFPEYTGRVCPAPCQSACVLGINEDPVTIKDNECAIIDKAYEEGWMKPIKPALRNGKRVCIVGSGPSGLAAADQLNQKGYSVTVLEREDRIGGLLMYGIPNMKLDKKLVEKRTNIMREEGIEFKTGVFVGQDVDPEELIENYDALLLAFGSTRPRDLPVEGRNLHGIHFAMDFLRANTKHLLSQGEDAANYISAQDKHVIVIGGGDTGNDCIGTSVRHGAASIVNFELLPKPHSMRSSEHPWPLYPRVLKNDYGHSEVSAVYGKDPREFSILTKEFLSDDGKKISALKTVRVKWEKPRKDAPPQMVEVPNSEETWKADLVLLALGFLGPEQELLERVNLERDARSNIKADYGSFATSRAKVFSAGDARRGQSLVVWAIDEGRNAAQQIHEYCSAATQEAELQQEKIAS